MNGQRPWVHMGMVFDGPARMRPALMMTSQIKGVLVSATNHIIRACNPMSDVLSPHTPTFIESRKEGWILLLCPTFGRRSERSDSRAGNKARNTVKTKPPFWYNTCFGCETETGVVRILVILKDRPMSSHII